MLGLFYSSGMIHGVAPVFGATVRRCRCSSVNSHAAQACPISSSKTPALFPYAPIVFAYAAKRFGPRAEGRNLISGESSCS